MTIGFLHYRLVLRLSSLKYFKKFALYPEYVISRVSEAVFHIRGRLPYLIDSLFQSKNCLLFIKVLEMKHQTELGREEKLFLEKLIKQYGAVSNPKSPQQCNVLE